MIEPIEVYETNDGKRHNTVKKAEAYVVDQVCELFANKIDKLKEDGMCFRRDTYTIVTSLAGDYDSVKNIYRELQDILGKED